MVFRSSAVKGLSILSFVVILSCFFSQNSFGQSAKEAIRALKKLNIQVESGMSYKRYAPALSDARFPVELFLESEEASEKPELSAQIKKTLEHYIFVNKLFWYEFEKYRGSPNLVLTKRMSKNTGDYEKCMTYPGWMDVTDIGPATGSKRILIKGMIPIVWKTAGEDLKIAEKLLKQESGEKGEKTGVTFYLSKAAIKDFDELEAKIKDGIKKNISRSQLIELAIKVTLKDLEGKGKKIKKYKELISGID